MILNIDGKPLVEGTLNKYRTKNGGMSIQIWWNKVISQTLSFDKMNEKLDELDENNIAVKETKTGYYTISSLAKLGANSYFIRYRKGDDLNVEVCGSMVDENGDIRLFRYVISKAAEDTDTMEAWTTYCGIVKEKTGKTLGQIFGGLPREYHKFRDCVPSPINWYHALYASKPIAVKHMKKADICSAYGSTAAGSLPECRISKGRVVKGMVEPTEDFPFAFYLHSKHMAVWGEGDTMSLNKSFYIKDNTVGTFEEETLLLPKADISLRPVYEELYQKRQLSDGLYKSAIVIPIGMFHRKRFIYQEDNLWPVAAVIKFRCNKRIVDTCEELKRRGNTPILINTDSMAWVGEGEVEDLFTTEKRLGNFCWENRDAEMYIRSSKIYQIQGEDGKCITRWSGSHGKKYTQLLAFGQIWDKKVYEFLTDLQNKNIVRWSKEKKRYVRKLDGQIYRNTKEDILWLKQD